MSDPRTMSDFWEGKCHDCGHDDHPLRSCHELVGGGPPGDGPQYCECARDLLLMEQEIDRLRAASPSLDRDRLRKVIEAELLLLTEPLGPFESGAAAAYHYVLAALSSEETT